MNYCHGNYIYKAGKVSGQASQIPGRKLLLSPHVFCRCLCLFLSLDLNFGSEVWPSRKMKRVFVQEYNLFFYHFLRCLSGFLLIDPGRPSPSSGQLGPHTGQRRRQATAERGSARACFRGSQMRYLGGPWVREGQSEDRSSLSGEPGAALPLCCAHRLCGRCARALARLLAAPKPL